MRNRISLGFLRRLNWLTKSTMAVLMLLLFSPIIDPVTAQVWLPGERTYIGISVPAGDVPSQQAEPVSIVLKKNRILVALKGEQAIGVFRRYDLAPLARWPLAGKTIELIDTEVGVFAVQQAAAFLTRLHPRSGFREAQMPLEIPIGRIATSQAGQPVGLLAVSGDQIDFLDQKTGQLDQSVAAITGISGVTDLAFSPDGKILAMVDANPRRLILRDLISDTEKSHPLVCNQTSQGSEDDLIRLIFTEENQLIIYCQNSGNLLLYDIEIAAFEPLLQEPFKQKYHDFHPLPNRLYSLLLPISGTMIDVFSVTEKRIIHSLNAGVGPHACSVGDRILYCVAEKEGILLRQELPPQMMMP